MTIKEGIEALYAGDSDVFVAGDLLWYPVEGDNKTRIAPDALIVYGRPKGERGSYQQWREGGIAPQVVFEVLSPGNRAGEMSDKYRFYARYGVEEYYLYNPFTYEFRAWLRPSSEAPFLEPIEFSRSVVSPRMGIRFEVSDEAELQIFGPNGDRFLTFVEQDQARRAAEEQMDAAAQRADAEAERANTEAERANAETERANRLAAQLRELGIDPQL